MKMKYFEGIDLSKLFRDNEPDSHKFGEINEELIRRAENTMGYRIPDSYRELLEYQNGGVVNFGLENSWLYCIYGIAPDPNKWNALEEMFDNWKNEWEYPDIGIPFGETGSAGHDMYYMDYRVTDVNGEPRIVRIDNEMDNRIYFVADNLVEFVKMIINDTEIHEQLIG